MKQKIPGLNGLRAIAASYIFIGHTYLIISLTGDVRGKIYHNLFATLPDMVNLFFVISGFIISYGLLQEKKSTRTISVVGFYRKRFYRIWPIYFLLFFVVYLLGKLSNLNLGITPFNDKSIIVISFFIVNLNTFIGAPLYLLPHYWSLSVEEQFYLFWPVFVKSFNIVKVSLFVILIVLISRNAAAYLCHHNVKPDFFLKLNEFLMATKFSSMGIGGIAAFFIYRHHPIVAWLRQAYVKRLVGVTFCLSFFCSFYLPYVNPEFLALLYALVIICFSGAKHFILDNRIINKIGTISYGIYMYQVPTLFLIIYFFKAVSVYNMLSQVFYLPLVLICYFITLIISYFSFYYVERYFIDRSHSTLTKSMAL